MSKSFQIGRREFLEGGFVVLGGRALFANPPCHASGAVLDPATLVSEEIPAWWPQSYVVERDDALGKLVVSTRYYQVEHDLRKGGAVSKIHCTYGKAPNLLLQPLAASVQIRGNEPAGGITAKEIRHRQFTDTDDASASVSAEKAGKWETVTVHSRLINHAGEDSGVAASTTYNYRWGYIKIHKEFRFPQQGIKIRRLSVLATLLEPSLNNYGYTPNPAAAFSPEILENGSSFWGKVQPGTNFDVPFETRYIPRYMVWANPGIEGLEWFASDALSQWDYQLAGRLGAGHASIQPSVDAPGVAISIDALNLAPTFNLGAGGYITAAGSYIFDYYIGIPILDGHGHNPWFERSFDPQGGKWVSADEIKRNAQIGVGTMTLHNDGDSHNDSLFWRDGSWPPYPPEQMEKMAKVIENCHGHGIRTVPYFSNHELHQTTPEFKTHGEDWGCKPDDEGNLRPNYNWGALMCLRSGWLDYFKLCVDRVLKHYSFDGVYYDWNQPLYCNNALHVGKTSNGVSPGVGSYALSPTGHWDVDELLELMEWTRERVGPTGLILVHNTMNPMLAVENFVNAVCTMEWGYGKVSSSMPKPQDLPLEWNMVGSRSRAVIEYGAVASNASAQVRQLFYLTALISGVATWPASDGVLEVFKLLKPLGDLSQYHFEDWRNTVVSMDNTDCYSAVYSRENEAWIVLANLGARTATVTCMVHRQRLGHPIAKIEFATLSTRGHARSLKPDALVHAGQNLILLAGTASLIHLRGGADGRWGARAHSPNEEG